MHIQDYECEDQGIIYKEVICYRNNSVVAEWHAGRRGVDVLYFMENGITVDKVHCEPIKIN